MKIRLGECKTRKCFLVLQILSRGFETPHLLVMNLSNLLDYLSHLTEKLLPFLLLFWLENTYFSSQMYWGPVYCHLLSSQRWPRASRSFSFIVFILLVYLCTAFLSFLSHHAAKLKSHVLPVFFCRTDFFCSCSISSLPSLGMSWGLRNSSRIH